MLQMTMFTFTLLTDCNYNGDLSIHHGALPFLDRNLDQLLRIPCSGSRHRHVLPCDVLCQVTDHPRVAQSQRNELVRHTM